MSSNERSGEAEKAAPGGLPFIAYIAVAAVFALIGFGAVYVTLGEPDNRKGTEVVAKVVPTAPSPATEAKPSASLPTGPGRNALSVGQMASFVFKSAPEDLPSAPFVDADGRERTLADWKGKVVLLNLWATWCAPCRKEMPGLDRLQAKLGSGKFEVVAVSVDRTGIDGARKFLEQVNARNLAVLADPNARMASTLKAIGLPATLLIDADGREIGRMVGPAEWDTPEAIALIRAALK
ncbi:MAG: TlpA family protein disulfide reductase [Hyphomicrobium sp.]|nr:TlpA family protein disulfide reductase [Hyphomicrobium sp.]